MGNEVTALKLEVAHYRKVLAKIKMRCETLHDIPVVCVRDVRAMATGALNGEGLPSAEDQKGYEDETTAGRNHTVAH